MKYGCNMRNDHDENEELIASREKEYSSRRRSAILAEQVETYKIPIPFLPIYSRTKDIPQQEKAAMLQKIFPKKKPITVTSGARRRNERNQKTHQREVEELGEWVE